MRLFERALRRASLPVAMSRGYNPRPQISLPAPLGVGIRGENEVLDFELSEWVRPEEVKQRLSSHLPEGIELRSLRTVPSKPDRQPRELSYRVPLLKGHPVTPAALEQVLRAEELIVQRTRKGNARPINVARFVRDLRLENGSLHILLAVTDRGTARPEEVLQALGCEGGRHYLESSIERTHVNLSSSL